jgi:hypothetical protein
MVSTAAVTQVVAAQLVLKALKALRALRALSWKVVAVGFD